MRPITQVSILQVRSGGIVDETELSNAFHVCAEYLFGALLGVRTFISRRHG